MEQPIFVTPDNNLQKVFDEAPAGAVIYLSAGIYRQKTVIRTEGLTIVGQGMDKTILIYDDYAKKPDEKGFAYITFRTFTLAVCADNVTMRDLAVVNDAKTPEVKGQEVALSVVADHFTMENCRLTSTQDTLFTGPLPEDLIERYTGFLTDDLRRGGEQKQVFQDCLIEGTVDFIFGCGNTLFEACELRSLMDARNVGYVAAPAHGLSQKEGYLFKDCRFTREDGVEDGTIYLARPWRDYGLSSFQHCTYGPHIHIEGFDKWSGTDRNETARFFESPAVPGRVAWINRE